MNQPQHSPLYGMTRTMSNPWPTRTACTAGPTHARASFLSDEPLRKELGTQSIPTKGWILLIAPPGRPAALHLQEQGLDPARVLIVHSSKIKNWQQTLERSLSLGHCAAVFTWLPEAIELDHTKLQRLEQQSGVFIRYLGDVTPRAAKPQVAYAEQDIYLNH
ncbi:cell division inhibitor [Aeromonas enteropelogenes]|uniref:cell division inhibitor n=1 Tax=Aeromonas enteropelogenes TaxID=29489 RepID=UPI00191EB88D|nr:cell division inhibitor [Aeromonas enteropelogenes]MBL0456740.1 cell division inhibitor [Aeromonas enteropelogenes]